MRPRAFAGAQPGTLHLVLCEAGTTFQAAPTSGTLHVAPTAPRLALPQQPAASTTAPEAHPAVAAAARIATSMPEPAPVKSRAGLPAKMKSPVAEPQQQAAAHRPSIKPQTPSTRAAPAQATAAARDASQRGADLRALLSRLPDAATADRDISGHIRSTYVCDSGAALGARTPPAASHATCSTTQVSGGDSGGECNGDANGESRAHAAAAVRLASPKFVDLTRAHPGEHAPASKAPVPSSTWRGDHSDDYEHRSGAARDGAAPRGGYSRDNVLDGQVR